MQVRQALACTIRGVLDITGTEGSSASNRALIDSFMAAPADASFSLTFQTGGISLGYFFADSPQGFSNSKDDLWTAIAKRAGKADLAQPDAWDSETQLLQIAVFVQAHVPEAATAQG